MLLVNIYAPNKDDVAFFQECFKHVDSFMVEYQVIGGDFNVTLNPLLDRKSSTKHNNHDKTASWLNSYIDTHELLDAWRHWHADDPGHTWRRAKPRLT